MERIVGRIETSFTRNTCRRLARYIAPPGAPHSLRNTDLTDSEAWRVVGRIWNRFLETGSAGRRPGQGRRRATMPNEDHYFVLTAQRHRNMNATLLHQHLRSATSTTVSTETVRNRFHGVAMYAHRSMICVRLISRHRLDRKE
ncbi:transposable element Tcb2 transposase [Trichonephila clavipes]|uniref:Transposable element Tcb2 transposase n=1 Tax=Trichonephila clavipes TaxID=2585209 RepID=A0A8X6SF02_TRICX|nr:transposable element Tcb2 transposase [Trichonephila clavipes]